MHNFAKLSPLSYSKAILIPHIMVVILFSIILFSYRVWLVCHMASIEGHILLSLSASMAKIFSNSSHSQLSTSVCTKATQVGKHHIEST